MGSKSLTPEQMEARHRPLQEPEDLSDAEFRGPQHPTRRGEKVTARKVFPVMAPADYQGRSAGAPVKGPRGLIVSIAECEPNNGPACIAISTPSRTSSASAAVSRFHGDEGEHKLVLEPNDMISVPRGENRMFFNISNEVGRLLVMIVPETDQQIDPISYAPSLGREIESDTASRR